MSLAWNNMELNMYLFLLYTEKDVKFFALLAGDFPQRSVLSLSHASPHSQQTNQYNKRSTIDPAQQETTTTTQNWLVTATTRCIRDP